MSIKESKAYSEAKIARNEKRFICDQRQARRASKAFHKVSRAASKNRLKSFLG